MDEITAGSPRRIYRAEVVRLPGDRAMVSGLPSEVGAVLAELQRRGRLVSASAMAPTGVPGQVMVNCRLLPVVQRAPELPARRRLSGRAWAAIAAAVLAVVGFFGYLAYEVLVLVLHNAWAIIGICAGVGLTLAVLGRACTTVITVRHHH